MASSSQLILEEDQKSFFCGFSAFPFWALLEIPPPSPSHLLDFRCLHLPLPLLFLSEKKLTLLLTPDISTISRKTFHACRPSIRIYTYKNRYFPHPQQAHSLLYMSQDQAKRAFKLSCLRDVKLKVLQNPNGDFCCSVCRFGFTF